MGPGGGAFLWWDSGHMNSLYWLMIGTELGHDTDASAHYNQDYEQPMTSLRQLLGGTGDSQNICMGSFDSWGKTADDIARTDRWWDTEDVNVSYGPMKSSTDDIIRVTVLCNMDT